MRVLYFDCFSGISGDMALGALLDVGLSLDQLRMELARLPISDWELVAERTTRGWLTGTRAHVTAPQQEQHRHLTDVLAILRAADGLDPTVIAHSAAVFRRLAEAEAAVHGIAPDEVHFHEVGALDAIIDIVGVVTGLHLLGIEQVFASALPLGTGWVHAAHGPIPVPAPAVLNLLATVQAPVLPDETPAELVTPTGAALLAELARFERPAMRLQQVGYGFGKRELAHPNALRVWIGEVIGHVQVPSATGQAVRNDAVLAAYQRPFAPDAPPFRVTSADDEPALGEANSSSPIDQNELVLLETNIDDQPGEQLAYVVEQLLQQGALDAWLAPIQMKKGRPATLLAALVPLALEAAARDLIFRETTTLGMRRRPVERHTCERDSVQVTTPIGSVRVKRKWQQGQLLAVAPEYEDCAALARAHNYPLREVYALAIAALDASV